MSFTILEEHHQRQWQDYTASTLWMIGKMFGRKNWELQPYTEFAYPHKVADQRTPQQIKDDIVRRLIS